jgi:mono/diheme cytochrome c family protein
MRTKLIAIGLFLVLVCLRTMASDPERAPDAAKDRLGPRFRETVLPFLKSNCLSCHGADKKRGDLDLSGYQTIEAVAEDLDRWDLVLKQLEAGTMPPAKAKQHPTPESRREVVAWIQTLRRYEAKRNAGDPGRVPARRLNNSEYDNTIRDLTGVDIRPTREFPVDPANEAGFDNSADSLTMSPALVKKYLQAARYVADHLVLKPDGIAFAPHPVVADTDRDKYCVRRVIDFYSKQRTDYADYFLAAWRFQHREALGQPKIKLEEIAAQAGISARYLTTVWSTLTEQKEEFGPIAALQAMWRELPSADKKPEVVRAECEKMRDFVVRLREKLVPEVKNLTAPGISNGSQPMVLWKNRQYAANRRRCDTGAAKLRLEGLTSVPSAAKALAAPDDPEALKRHESAFARFCSVFPDAFFVKERARVYLDPKQEKQNAGRLLSAGFHSMTGYFRDDGPLSELMLDEQGRRELDRLWREFDFITGAPMRQYSSFLWFERAETSYLRDNIFDFVRAEDKDASSDAKMRRLAEIYLDKARRLKASATALQAIEDHFKIISAAIRRVEQDRLAAEPSHIQALQNFAERAYRRPLAKAERDGIAEFYRSLRKKDGLNHEDAVRDTLVRVLMSPHFCYRVDLLAQEKGTGTKPLSDYALASRLSYFLWASMPDKELLDRAAAGELHRPEVLVAQARRMLKDERVRGLATEFGGNWLDFRRFEEHNSVDRRRFPTFDDELRRAMFEEPIQFFLDLVRRDRSVYDFLDADYTFVNPALARHYGMPDPGGGPDHWTRVDDARRHGRGGLLPMAVFLTKNAPGLRTSPVKRGQWVVRRLLGENIPPPPPQVPELPADEAKLGERTLRETLAKHRDNKSCASCHERIDPIGLAFEGFGPVGERRDVDLGGRPVDARATFPGGGEGTGVEGLRAYLRDRRRNEFIDNLCRKLLAYALGRNLIPSDDETIEAMRARLEADRYRFGGLIDCIVAGKQFRFKRLDSKPIAR